MSSRLGKSIQVGLEKQQAIEGACEPQWQLLLLAALRLRCCLQLNTNPPSSSTKASSSASRTHHLNLVLSVSHNGIDGARHGKRGRNTGAKRKAANCNDNETERALNGFRRY